MCFESLFERKTGTIPTVFGWDLVEEEEYYVLIEIVFPFPKIMTFKYSAFSNHSFNHCNYTSHTNTFCFKSLLNISFLFASDIKAKENPSSAMFSGPLGKVRSPIFSCSSLSICEFYPFLQA